MSAPASAKKRPPLTDQAIRAFRLPEEKREALVWDGGLPGLALRVGVTRRTWVYVFRPLGAGAKANPQKITLGAWPALTINAARLAAKVEAGKIAKGEDPAATRREAKRAEVSKVSAVLIAYEAALESKGYVNKTTAMSTLRRNLESVKSRDIASLTRSELVELIDRLENARKPGAAADLRGHLRTLLEWCTSRGVTPFNVLAGLRRERATRAQRLAADEKGRALADGELRSLWHAADAAAVLGRYIRALILTGARRGEMSRLRWSMVTEDRLVLPPSHTKQGRPHEIPITPLLRGVLDACAVTSSGLVFASPLTNGEMRGWTQHVAKLRKASGVEFTLHDLRRTMRSGMGRLGVEDGIAELMLGHQRDDLERRYDKDPRWEKRVRAAAIWSQHVAELTARPAGEASNVVKLSTRKKRAAER